MLMSQEVRVLPQRPAAVEMLVCRSVIDVCRSVAPVCVNH